MAKPPNYTVGAHQSSILSKKRENLFRATSGGAIAPPASPVPKDLYQSYRTNDLTAFLFVWHSIFLLSFQIKIMICQQNLKFQEIIA